MFVCVCVFKYSCFLAAVYMLLGVMEGLLSCPFSLFTFCQMSLASCLWLLVLLLVRLPEGTSYSYYLFYLNFKAQMCILFFSK